MFNPPTECEVLSNETTKVRVMDIPGFFDRILLQKIPKGVDPLSPQAMNNVEIASLRERSYPKHSLNEVQLNPVFHSLPRSFGET